MPVASGTSQVRPAGCSRRWGYFNTSAGFAQIQGLAATNQRFNGTARQQANTLHVELVDGDDLEVLLAKHPVKRGELEGFLLASWAS